MVAALLSTPDGDPAVAVGVCYYGPTDRAEAVLKPLKAFGSPLADSIQPLPYMEQQKLLDDAWPPGDHYYWKTSLVSNLSDDAIEVLVEHAAKSPSPLCAVALQQLHGAATRVLPHETAFAHRYDHYNFIPLARWTTAAEAARNIEWARNIWRAMQPYADDAVYGNDLGDEENERVLDAYGSNHQRLVALKTRYDPTNLFQLNQNIRPSAA